MLIFTTQTCCSFDLYQSDFSIPLILSHSISLSLSLSWSLSFLSFISTIFPVWVFYDILLISLLLNQVLSLATSLSLSSSPISMSLYLSDILSQCVSVSLITSFCITLSRSLSLSLFLHYGHSLCLFFPPFSPHTIRLLFSIQVRSFTGSPFSDEFDEDNQMAKFDTNAYGIWKTNPSYIHSQSRYLTLYPCISFLIFVPLSLILFH